jgi:hypothetical protein
MLVALPVEVPTSIKAEAALTHSWRDSSLPTGSAFLPTTGTSSDTSQIDAPSQAGADRRGPHPQTSPISYTIMLKRILAG